MIVAGRVGQGKNGSGLRQIYDMPDAPEVGPLAMGSARPKESGCLQLRDRYQGVDHVVPDMYLRVPTTARDR